MTRSQLGGEACDVGIHRHQLRGKRRECLLDLRHRLVTYPVGMHQDLGEYARNHDPFIASRPAQCGNGARVVPVDWIEIRNENARVQDYARHSLRSFRR